MTKKNTPIAVVGSGVNGLSSAVRLLEAGFKNVTIIAENFHPHITSSIAAAIWMPFKVEPEHKVKQWAQASLAYYQQLITKPKLGIRWLPLIDMYPEKITKPFWIDLLSTTNVPKNFILPTDCQSYFAYNTLQIDTSIYLLQLQQHFLQLGGKIEQRKLNSLNELNNYSIIINCAGLGARQLVNDKKIYPIRGQMVKITKPKDLDFAIVHMSVQHLTCVFPRQHDCVVGGTIEPNEWDTTPDTVKTQQMLERAIKLVPQLAQEKIIESVVGLRPAREEVRLELEHIHQKPIIIHNYGHGGAGITLAWGCAEHVLQLVNEYVSL
jgi:D-amino-acid oxidase